MIYKENIDIKTVSWIKSVPNGGGYFSFFIPEDRDELRELCVGFYNQNKSFELIGHASNVYFVPGYCGENLISTRKVSKWYIYDDYIECDSGVSVAKLSRQMVGDGIQGFEGLVDLPGTIGAAIYGNAGCFGCSIVNLLIDFQLLLPDCSIKTLTVKDLEPTKRMTNLKSGSLHGVILSARLRKQKTTKDLIAISNQNHDFRKATQPSPENNLGYIFRNEGKRTVYHWLIKAVVKTYGILLSYLTKEKCQEDIEEKKRRLFFRLCGASELLPYVYNWGTYIWKDELSHSLFWKFVRIHRLLFTRSDFEIEIRGDYEHKTNSPNLGKIIN